jgi:SAM-dependent methyltransferase
LDEHGSRKVIDISCGTGSHLVNLLKRGANEEFIGIDASEEMIRLAREKLIEYMGNFVSLIRADFLHPPFTGGSFDAVLCLYWSLAGLNENLVRKLFFEVAVLTKRNGIFVFDTENAEGIKENLLNYPFIDAFFPATDSSGKENSMLIRANFSKKIAPDLVDWHAYYLLEHDGVSQMKTDRMNLRFYSKGQLESLLREAGFKVLEVLSGPFLKYAKGSSSLYFIARKD